jgi:predicted GIY-YIG superfamily endonuclease
MRAINLFPCVYVLELEGDESYDRYFYVGCTHNLNHRLSSHIAGLGANWTKLHEFKCICEVRMVIEGSALDLENEVTLEYISKYGAERVRGGKFIRC